jgi:hypothetical protein
MPRLLSRLAVRCALVASAGALLASAAGCTRHPSGHAFVPRAYPDGADGLKQLWSDVLTAAQKDEREHVHDLLATTFLSDDELRALLGPRAEALLPRYHQLMGTLVNRGAVELVAQVYEHKYDAIDVLPDDSEATLTPLLTAPHLMWTARVRKASETLGLRYNGFLYLDGKWRTLNQLAKYVDDGKEPAAR